MAVNERKQTPLKKKNLNWFNPTTTKKVTNQKNNQ